MGSKLTPGGLRVRHEKQVRLRRQRQTTEIIDLVFEMVNRANQGMPVTPDDALFMAYWAGESAQRDREAEIFKKLGELQTTQTVACFAGDTMTLVGRMIPGSLRAYCSFRDQYKSSDKIYNGEIGVAADFTVVSSTRQSGYVGTSVPIVTSGSMVWPLSRPGESAFYQSVDTLIIGDEKILAHGATTAAAGNRDLFANYIQQLGICQPTD